MKKERVKVLLNTSLQLENEYAKKSIHQTVDVITEEYVGQYVVGFTSNYLKVYLKGDYPLGKRYACVVDRVDKNILYAHVISCLTEEIKL